MDKISVDAYAKINLTLDVLRRRPDGYHELEMIMQTIDLFDTVDVEKNGTCQNRVFSDSSKVPEGETNTAYIAAEAMAEKFALKEGVDIRIKKRIPVAAGLAGGSADAAAVIKAMRSIFVPHIPAERFVSMASSIGKDVPFCLKGGTAFAFGLGDKLAYIKDCPMFFVVLAKPDIDVSTASVYRALKLDEVTERPDTQAMLKAIVQSDMNKVAGGIKNVLDSVTAKQYPVIRDIKAALLENGAMASAMSGSGPSVYGLFDNRDFADKAAEAVKRKFGIKEVFSTQTVNPQS